jgi:polar amino acid transport system substrate-binding protein
VLPLAGAERLQTKVVSMITISIKTTLLFVLVTAMSLVCAAPRPLVIVSENYAPSTFIENNRIVGFDVDIAKAVLDHLGVQYTIQIVPWARAYAMLKNGQADIGLHVSYSAERANFMRWPTTPVWVADFVFMTTQNIKSRYDVKSYDDTKRFGLAIGVIQNNSYAPAFWDAYPSPNRENQEYNKQLDPAADAATNLIKLAAGRIQLFPFPLILGKYMTRVMKLDNLTNYDWVIFSKPYPTAFGNASKFSTATYPNIWALMRAYDKELAHLKSDRAQYSQFFEHYQVHD